MTPNNWFSIPQSGQGPDRFSDSSTDGLKLALRLFHTALNLSSVAVAITDPDGRYRHVNDRFLELSGYSRDDLAEQSLSLTHTGDALDALWQTVNSGDAWHSEHIAQRKSGELYRESEVITPVFDDQGGLAGLVAVREDICARVRQESQQAAGEAFDDLTGMLNGSAFNGAIAEYMRQAAQGPEGFSFILLELDTLDAMVEAHGAESGDRVVRELAQLIRRCLRTPDVLGRRDSGDFAVLLPGTSLDRAEVIAERLRHNVAVDNPGGLAVSREGGSGVTVSLGVTHYQLGDDVGSLLARADQALYRARTEGGNRVVSCSGRYC